MHGRTCATRNSLPCRLLAAVCALASSALPGCATAQATLPGATAKYESGQYQLALNEGTEVATKGPAADRPQAELLAGMAAYQLDRFDEAERHFLVAERTGSPPVRGRARIMLGNIRVEQERLGAAADLFESGAADLAGTDADKARRFAALARSGQIGAQPSGSTTAIASSPSQAAPSATSQPASVAPRTAPPQPAKAAVAQAPARASANGPRAAQKPVPAAAATDAAAGARTAAQKATGTDDEGSAFTVRAGAYTTESAARRRMKALDADVRRAKVPAARVERIQTKEGDTLFAVRIGTFRSRAEAEAALKRLARKDLAVGAI